MSSARPIRIVSIAHPAVSRDAGRLRYYPLAARPDIDLHVVVPKVFHQFGRALHADPPDDSGLKVHILPIMLDRAGPMSWYLHVYPGLRRLLSQVDPDVIHLWEEPWSLVALQARILKGRAALVMEVDQNILKRLPPPFEAIRRSVLRNTDHVLSRSPEATAVVRARGYRGPATPIAYGVDQATFFPDPATLSQPRESSGLTIGYVGRLVEEKGLEDALDAMARCKAPISLAIMGEGPHEGRLRQRIAELGLSGRVTIRGWGAPADVAAFLRALDVMILLTRTTKRVREQFGRVIVEAQSCGVPVIGSQSGAIPCVVAEGGWIVAERDPDGLARLLDGIHADPATRLLKAARARDNAMARFTYEAVAAAIASACASAVETRRKAAAGVPNPRFA